MKLKVGQRYWVQVTYAVISPDGSAEDYFHDKKSAINCAKLLNKNKSNIQIKLREARK